MPPNRPFRKPRQHLPRLPQSDSLSWHLCRSLQQSTKHERCSDVDQEAELFVSAVVLNELPYSPWPSLDRLCSSLLRCSCLCSPTLGRKPFGGGRNYRSWGHQSPSVAEVKDKQQRSLMHMQNLLVFLWQLHDSQCNYASGWGVGERLKKGRMSKEGKKEKENTEQINYWPQTYHNFREATEDLKLNFYKNIFF